VASLRSANAARKGLPVRSVAIRPIKFPFIFMNEIEAGIAAAGKDGMVVFDNSC